MHGRRRGATRAGERNGSQNKIGVGQMMTNTYFFIRALPSGGHARHSPGVYSGSQNGHMCMPQSCDCRLSVFISARSVI